VTSNSAPFLPELVNILHFNNYIHNYYEICEGMMYYRLILLKFPILPAFCLALHIGLALGVQFLKTETIQSYVLFHSSDVDSQHKNGSHLLLKSVVFFV